MKHIGICIIMILVLGSCKNQQENRNVNTRVVTVSILPQKYFIEKIATNTIEVNVMIPPGASPVTYEPTPKQMKELSSSSVYFRIGHIEFEKSWMKKLQDINPKMDIINISKTANLIEPDHKHEGVHNHEGHHYHGVDPHIWLSPKEVKKQTEIVYKYFINKYPKSEPEITNNYESFKEEIDSLDLFITDKLKPFKGKKFLIYHPALTYLARDYGLEQITIEIDGKEPTPANIQRIIDTAIKENIKIVFVQKQFNTNNAEVIAQEIKGRVVQIDPLAENWGENIKLITDEIVKSYSLN